MPPSSKSKPRPVKAPVVSSEVSRFRALGDQYLEEICRLFPQDASEMGFHEHDGTLGQNTPALHKEYERLVETILREVEVLADSAFTGDDWLDRRGFLALLRTSLFSSRRGTWRINPQVHCGAAVDSVFNLLVRNADRLAGILPAIQSRLAEIPRFLQQGAACVQKPVPLWTKLAVQSSQGSETFLLEAGAEVALASPTPEKTLALFQSAAAAFRKYAQVIAAKEPGPENGFAVGAEGFEFLVRERTGLPYSCAEVRATGERLCAQLNSQLDEEVRKFGKKKASQILEAAAHRWQPTVGPLLEEYQRANAKVKGDFQQSHLMTFPEGERCLVMQVPSFLRQQFPTAAYHQPGAFDPDQTGIFWVNDLSLTQKTPVKRAAEVRQHFGLEFTCAHEAYPGHHLQFCIQNRHPSKLRRLFHHAIFYEGWTLWCEKMCVEQGVIELPEARLIQLHDALWRAHRIVIDVSLHDGAFNFNAACRRLQTGVGFTPARARGDVNWYTSNPTVPMSYLLGRLENERLHARLVQRDGWDLRRFNDWLLSFGAIPQRWIWEAELRGLVRTGCSFRSYSRAVGPLGDREIVLESHYSLHAKLAPCARQGRRGVVA